MGTLVDQEFFAKLRALNEKFAATVPATLASLRAAYALCVAGRPDDATLRELHRTLHTVAGSAATFGFAVMGRQARALEQRMRTLTELHGVPAAGGAEWEQWLASLDRFLRWAAIDPKAATFDSDFSY